MIAMPKQPPRRRGRPSRRPGEPTDSQGKTGSQLSVRIDAHIKDALDAYCDSKRPRIIKNDAVMWALQRFLHEEGFLDSAE